MKTHRFSLLLTAALATFSFASLTARAQEPVPTAYPIHQVEKWNGTVRPGTDAWIAEGLLGRPRAKLSSQVWVYTGYRAEPASAETHACSLLVVTFADGRVSEMRFVNDSAFAALAGNLKSGRAATLVARK